MPHYFRIHRDDADPEATITRIVEESGREEEHIRKLVSYALRPRTQDEEAQDRAFLELHGYSPEQIEADRRAINIVVNTVEEQAEFARLYVERRRHFETLYEPIKNSIEDYVREQAASGDEESRLGRLRDITFLVSGKTETSDELLTWLTTSESDELWGQTPLDIVVRGDNHQFTALLVYGMNYNKPDGAYTFDMTNVAGEWFLDQHRTD